MSRTLIVVAGTPARGSLKMVVPPEIEVLVPGELPAQARYDRILVQKGAKLEARSFAVMLAIGGELHVLDTLPEIVADCLFPTGLVSDLEDTYRRLVARA